MKRSEPSVASFFLSLVLVLAVILSTPFWSGWSLYRAKDPEELLTLKVVFENYDASCYEGRSMIVASDPEFKNRLLRVDVKSEGGTYFYSYDYSKLPDTVYVIPPTLLAPVVVDSSETVTISLNSEEKSAVLDGQELFRVTSVEHTKIASGVFNIDLTITPVSQVFPIRSELILGDVVLEQKNSLQDSVFSFSDTDGFEMNTIHFVYNTGAKEDISDILDSGSLVVKEMLRSADEAEAKITSENQSVNIVVSDPENVV